MRRDSINVIAVQVYKTGEKVAGKVSRRGPKPIGWNLYDRARGTFLWFAPNTSSVYDYWDNHQEETGVPRRNEPEQPNWVGEVAKALVRLDEIVVNSGEREFKLLHKDIELLRNILMMWMMLRQEIKTK